MRREVLKTAYEQLADAEELRKAGQLELAHRITSALVKQFPTYWAALHTHALVLAGKADFRESLKFLLLADNTCPNQVMTILALAQAMLNCGLVDQALECTQRGLAITPKHPELLFARAEVLRAVARYAEAEPLYRSIEHLQGAQLNTSLALANCLLELGHMHAAAEKLETAVARWPGAFEPLYELSSFPREFLSCDPTKLLEQWMTNRPEGRVDDASLAFAQSWTLHRDGRFEEAWRHLKRANRLVFQVERNTVRQELDRKWQELRRLEATTGDIDWRPVARDENCPSVLFVLGPSRSGKSTLEAMLASCGLVRGDESNLIATTVRDTLQSAGLVPFEVAEALPKHVRDGFAARYRERVGQMAGPRDCVTITNPDVIADAPYLIALIPNIRFMLVDRDTDDLVFSILQQHYARGNFYSYSLATAKSYVDWYRSMGAVVRKWAPDLTATCTYSDLMERSREVVASVERLLERDLTITPKFRGAFDGRNCSAPYRDWMSAELATAEDQT